VDIVTTSKTQ